MSRSNDPVTIQRQRIDQWLWMARFFKTRSLAAQAVEAGRARVGGERVKPSRELKPGDEVLVRSGELEWKVEVRAMGLRRGPASEAMALYAEGEESRTRREQLVAMRKATPRREAHEGRPTKRERREIDRFKRGS